MIKFFFRNAPTTVQDALQLTKQEFVNKYKETKTTVFILENAYDEIRVKNKHLIPSSSESKEVKFKVVQTDEQVKSIATPVNNMEVVNEIVQRELEPDEMLQEGELPDNVKAESIPFDQLINAARGRDESGVNEDELSDEEVKELAMLEAANEVEQNAIAEKAKKLSKVIKAAIEVSGNGTASNPVKVKSNRGRKRYNDADARDERIIELLKEGKKGTEILKQMKEENFSVHAPQITRLKQVWEKEQVEA